MGIVRIKIALIVWLAMLLATLALAVWIGLHNLSAPIALPDALWFVGLLTVLIVGAGGLLTRRLINHYDGAHQASEARLLRLNRFYVALSRTNQLIVREHDEQTLFENICEICVSSGHARMACVYLIDDDGKHALRTATAGPAAQFMAGIPERWDMGSDEAKSSITVKAMREDVHVVSQDYQNDPRAAPWRNRAIEHGIRAMALLPLRRGSAVVGALMLCGDQVGFFDEPLVTLLDEMTRDLSFALDNIDREAARIKAVKLTETSLVSFSRLFHSSPIATVILSLADSRVRDINDIACRRYGLTREEFIGHSFMELGLGLIEDDHDAFFEQVRLHGRVGAHYVQVRTRPGEIRDSLITAESINHLGEPCLLTMGLDVTELRQAEQARQTLVEVEATSRAKSLFLSQMSHELRTPLNAVLGFSQLLLADAREQLTPSQFAQLEHIRRAGWHLLALINDVLDVSRIEAGHMLVEAQALELGPLLDEALNMTQALAQPLAVSLTATAPPSAYVLADPIRLRQVLINLLSNAVKYNRPGGSVHMEVLSQGDRVMIDIVDSGIGMTADQLAHLYEPFNRLGRERGSVEGCGIGLALTRQLVRLMQGQMEIESEVAVGTRVRISLPACHAVAVRDAPAIMTPNLVAPDAAASATEPAGVVLYIEDNPVNLLLVEQLLARWCAVRLVQAEDGASGIELATSLLPDLVLLDMQLPDMDGIAVLRALRAASQTHDLTIIALSASAMPDVVMEARASGASDYWTKPLDFDRFLSDIQSRLPTRSLKPQGAATGVVAIREPDAWRN